VSVRDIDYRGALEFGEHATDRFNGQAKIVGNVLSRHWNINFISVPHPTAFGQLNEEGRNTLERALTAKDHKMILRSPQVMTQI
jgi:hypothetical protein